MTVPRRRWSLRFKLLTLFVAVTVLTGTAGVLAIALRRPDITDPNLLARMPQTDLRDAEVETLVRAAFRSAEKIEIHWRVDEADGKHAYLAMSVTDRSVLNDLADRFEVGWDGQSIGYRRYPGIDYLSLEFTGPYNPHFIFAGHNRIYIFGGRMVAIPTAFAKTLADIAGIENSPAP